MASTQKTAEEKEAEAKAALPGSITMSVAEAEAKKAAAEAADKGQQVFGELLQLESIQPQVIYVQAPTHKPVMVPAPDTIKTSVAKNGTVTAHIGGSEE